MSHALKAQQATNNMTVANTYAVMNLLSAAWTLIVVLLTEASTISKEWEHATKKVAGSEIIKNVALSGFFFYLYNELAFLVCLCVCVCERAIWQDGCQPGWWQ